MFNCLFSLLSKAIDCRNNSKMNFKLLALFATILTALVVFGDAAPSETDENIDLSIVDEEGSLITVSFRVFPLGIRLIT